MSGQNYRVIADRDKGDDPQWTDVQLRDRYTCERHRHDQLVRIERPVPTADDRRALEQAIGYDPVPLSIRNHPEIRFEYRSAADRDGLVDRILAAGFTQHPSVPTREQIAETIANAEDADYWIDEVRQWEAQEQWGRDAHPEEYPGMAYEDRESFLRTAAAVLALIQNGTER